MKDQYFVAAPSYITEITNQDPRIHYQVKYYENAG